MRFVCAIRSSLSVVSLAAMLLASVIAPASTCAQTVAEGSIRGYVQDEQGGFLPAVAVTATSPQAPGAYHAVTDATGYYRLLNLPPATYTIAVDVQGFAKFSRPNVAMRAGLNIGIDIVLKVGVVGETVEVNVDSPMLESRTASQGLNVSGDLQRGLPLSIRRNWSDFMMIAPGTVSSASTGSGSFYVHGADFGSHVIQVDGADVSAPAQSSTLYLVMSSEVLQDVQVKTTGIDAAAPLGQGAVMNVVTQSGTDRFRGTGLMSWQRRDWSANNNPGGTTSAYELVQPEVSFGGPVARERAWFFSAYRYSRLTSGISRTPDQLRIMRALVPEFEPFDAITTSHQPFVKLTAQLTPHHRLQVFQQHGEDRSFSIGPTYEVKSRATRSGGNPGAAHLASVWGEHLSTRIGVAYADASTHDTLMITDTPARPVHAGTLVSSGRLVGTGALAILDNFDAGANDTHNRKLTFTADATWYKTGWIGTHEFQGGLYLQPGRVVKSILHYANDGFVVEDLVLRDQSNPSLGARPFHRLIYDTPSFTGGDNLSDDYAGYAQDVWRATARLTISAGLRLDAITRRDRLFNVTTQDTLAIGPRLGLNLRLTEDGRHIVRASWGRVHDAVAGGTRFSAGTVSAGSRDLYDFDGDGTFETTFVNVGTNTVIANRVVDRHGFRQPYNTDLQVGYLQQLPGQISVEASVVRRKFLDRAALVDVNGIYTDGVFQGYRDPSQSDIYRLTSNIWNWPVYTGLQLQVVKQTARLQLIANYTRQFRRIDGTWQPNDPASFIQPDAFANDKGIGDVLRLQTTNSLSGTDMTSANQWHDHALRIAAAVQAPWRLSIATSYTLQSGVWSGPIITRVAASDPRFGPATVTLPTGRVVSNPLATVNRFANDDRGAGQVHAPALHVFNLRVARELSFGTLRVEPALDVLNVANAGATQSFMSGANQTYNPNFGLTSGRQPPRSAQCSVRVRF
jgi:hypothetical protein